MFRKNDPMSEWVSISNGRAETVTLTYTVLCPPANAARPATRTFFTVQTV